MLCPFLKSERFIRGEEMLAPRAQLNSLDHLTGVGELVPGYLRKMVLELAPLPEGHVVFPDQGPG